MKIWLVILVGFLLLLVMLLFVANSNEGGDPNAIGMYLVVFISPCVIIALLNGLYIKMISRLQNKISKALLSFVPVVLLLVLSFQKNVTIAGVDGNLAGIALIGAIAFAITNASWSFGLWKNVPETKGATKK